MPVKPAVSFGLAVLLAGAVAVAYLPVLRAGFVWNDDTYLTDNRTLDGAARPAGDLDRPAGERAVLPARLLLVLDREAPLGAAPVRLPPRQRAPARRVGAAALAPPAPSRACRAPGSRAALFALHPVCVESVAWVTERKNTLSLLLSLLAALAYLSWSERRATQSDRRGRACP